MVLLLLVPLKKDQGRSLPTRLSDGVGQGAVGRPSWTTPEDRGTHHGTGR